MATRSEASNSIIVTKSTEYDDMAPVHACKAGHGAAFEERVNRYSYRPGLRVVFVLHDIQGLSADETRTCLS
jgi:hypothetical protein